MYVIMIINALPLWGVDLASKYTESDGRIGGGRTSSVGDWEFGSWSILTNGLYNWYFSRSSQVLGIIKIGQGLVSFRVRIMWLSGDLISQFDSAIKSSIHPDMTLDAAGMDNSNNQPTFTLFLYNMAAWRHIANYLTLLEF